MKKIFIIIINIVFYVAFALKGHTQNSLSVGQKIPDLTVADVINYKTSTLKFSDFRGKVVILDFWATWCSPCISMMPKMEALQTEFDGKIQFLSVGYQTKKEIADFYKKLEKQTGKTVTLPQITNDKTLNQLFPHQFLPHYVWISPDGIVKAISGYTDINRENIEKIISSGTVKVGPKEEKNRTYNHSEPLLFSGNEKKLLMGSQLTGYIDGAGRGIYTDVFIDASVPLKRITARNLTMIELFTQAYRKEKKEIIIEVKEIASIQSDKTGNEFMDWVKNDKSYCYELQLPESEKDNAFVIMQGQLRSFFSKYDVGLERRKMKCLALVRTMDEDKLHTKGGQPIVSIDRFGCNFQSCFLKVVLGRFQLPLQSYPLPLIDATNYKDMVDIKLSCDMSNVEDINRALVPYGLKFEEVISDLEVLVIKDKTKIQ